MAIQTAVSDNLAVASAIVIAALRYTAENATPCQKLIERFTLGKGEKQITVPKANTVIADALVDGVDMVDSKDLAMTSVDLTTGEVGLKFILTDKLVRQQSEDMFKVVGRLGGDAMARKLDQDILALFSALNSGTVLGADNRFLYMRNAGGCLAFAHAQLYPKPVYVVHHPNAIFDLMADSAAIGATTASVLKGDSIDELPMDFWKIRIGGIDFFEDGNIAKISGYDSGYGAIFSKSAMCYVESLAPTSKTEEDISLRATELVIVSDYGVFELDNAYGAPMQYEIGAALTTST